MKTAARYVVLGALFLIPFLPLYVANDLFFPFITGKNFWFRILVEIAVGGWVLLMLADAKYRPKFSWTLAAFGALVAWMAVANLLGVNPEKSFWSNFERMDGWVTFVHAFLFFLVAGSVLRVEKLWRKWWLVFIGAAGLVVLYGLLQLAGGAEINQGGVRVDATFGNAAYLAAYLLFVIAVTVWQALVSKGWLRYALGVLAVLEVIVLFATSTRGAILGFIGAAALAAVLFAVLSGKKGRRVAGGALVALVLLVGGFVAFKDAPFIQNDPTLTRLASISLEEGATRFAIWNMAVEGGLERPLTGWGQEGFSYVFTKNYEPSLYAQEPWFDRAHNLYLDWFIAGGFPALLLFLLLLGSAVYALFVSDASREKRVLLIAALAAYAFQGLFVFDNLFTYVSLAAVLAVAHGLSARPVARLEALPTVPEPKLQAIALPVVVVVVGATVWAVNLWPMQTAHAIIRGITAPAPTQGVLWFDRALTAHPLGQQEVREHLVQYANAVEGQEVSDEAKEEVYALAEEELQEFLAGIRPDARLLMLASTLNRNYGQFDRAREYADRAITLSPKKQSLYLERGLIEWQAENLEAAAAAFTAAYELDSSFSGTATYAAAGKVLTGDVPGAKALIEEHYGTRTVDQPHLLLAYYQTKHYDEVAAIWELRVMNSDGAPSARYSLAAAYALAGRGREAVEEIQATMAEYPETASQGVELLMRLGAVRE